jgi:aryl carrier-like protein
MEEIVMQKKVNDIEKNGHEVNPGFDAVVFLRLLRRFRTRLAIVRFEKMFDYYYERTYEKKDK